MNKAITTILEQENEISEQLEKGKKITPFSAAVTSAANQFPNAVYFGGVELSLLRGSCLKILGTELFLRQGQGAAQVSQLLTHMMYTEQ